MFEVKAAGRVDRTCHNRVSYGKQWWRLVVLAALMPMLAVAQPRPGGFQVIGPGGGGAMFRPTISPIDPRTVLVACDMSGSYITHDGGDTWRMFNLRGGVREFAFDPVNPAVIYAAGIGIWRSDDSGRTWRLLVPNPAKLRGIEDAGDEAEEQLLTTEDFAGRDETLPRITAIAVDPAEPKSVYAVIGSKLWRSKDGGNHWSDQADLPKYISEIVPVHNGKGDPDVWIANSMGFWSVHGSSVRPMDGPPPPGPFKDQAVEILGDKTVLTAVAGKQLYQATVNTSTKNVIVPWTLLPLPGEKSIVTAYASGHDGRTMYVSYSELVLDGHTWLGIAKSTDAGAHWDLLTKDYGRGASNVRDGWLTDAFASDWGEEPLGLAVADKDHSLLYATDLGRTLKSTDAGAHWTAVYSHTTSNGRSVSSGLDVLTGYGVHFDPFDTKRMFISYTDVGLFRSDDGGESWTSSHEGSPWRSNTYWMVFDPAVRGRVWAAMSTTHDLPRPRVWRRSPATTFRGGVVVSLDGGVHWSVAGTGLPEGAVTHMVLDPKSPVERRILYAAVMGHGVYKSVDGGRTWAAKSQGISQQDPLAWRLARSPDGTLYLVVARETTSLKIGGPSDGALYRSRNGAETWERMALPEGVNGPNGLIVDPRDPSRLYLAAWARPVGPRGVGGGIYGSKDGGATWQLLFGADQHIYSVTYNPQNPSEMYAVGFSSSAWHSTDSGAHWQRIAGYNFKAGHRVFADPVHPGMVYITTFGGGVWHGAVNGKPGVEDIATREIAP